MKITPELPAVRFTGPLVLSTMLDVVSVPNVGVVALACNVYLAGSTSRVLLSQLT